MKVRHANHVGLGDFTPGLASAANAGVKVSRQPYPPGQAGVRLSLTKMAEIIREGANDPHVKELAWKVLNEAGFNGRGASAGTALQRFTALVVYVRKWMLYAPDSPGTETMLSAAAMLCLRPGVCVRMGDCFPEGTLLLRDDYELVPIEKIKPGDRIWGRDKWTTVKDAWFTGKKKIDTIVLNNGSQVPLSREHHVFVAKCKKHSTRCWCPVEERDTVRVGLSDLQEGDALIQPKRIEFGSGSVEPDLAYVEGLYVSDGWSEESRFSISGQDGCRKEAQKLEVKAICERRGVPTRWHRKYIAVNDKVWAQKLAALGTRARFKHVSTINLEEASLTALLRGVMADSAANTRGVGRTFSTTSELLMVQVRVMQRMCGRSTSVRRLTPQQHGGAGKHALWRVGVRVPTEQNDKILRVKEIHRDTGAAQCWDFTTDDGFVYLPAHDVTVSNCDDLTDLLGAMTMAAGIPVRILKQNYGAGAQEHVLIEALCEGRWVPADPSTDMAVGNKPVAVNEDRVDPLDVKTPVGTAGPELITIGAAPTGVGFCDYDMLQSVRVRLLNPWITLYNDAKYCTGLSPDLRAALNGDYWSFQSWANAELPVKILCGDFEKAYYRQAADYEQRLGTWRAILTQTQCEVTEPQLPPLRDDDPRSPNYKPPQDKNLLDDLKSALIMLGVAAGVGAGIYITVPLLREASSSLASSMRRRKKTA